MATILRQRRDTEANWTSANPVIPGGQLCFDTTNNTFRIGNGIDNYLDLPIQSGVPGADGTISGVLNSNLDCNGHQIIGSSYQQIPNATLGTGTHTFDYSAGDMQQLTATGDIAIAFSNFIAEQVCLMIIDVVNFGDYTITHPTGLLFSSATAPTYTSGGMDRLLIIKDSSDVYSLFIIGQAVSS